MCVKLKKSQPCFKEALTIKIVSQRARALWFFKWDFHFEFSNKSTKLFEMQQKKKKIYGKFIGIKAEMHWMCQLKYDNWNAICWNWIYRTLMTIGKWDKLHLVDISLNEEEEIHTKKKNPIRKYQSGANWNAIKQIFFLYGREK